jgi:hypothetical protein
MPFHRGRRGRSGEVFTENARKLSNVDIAGSNRDHHGLGLIDGDLHIAVVEEQENPGSSPRQPLVAVDEGVVTGE